MLKTPLTPFVVCAIWPGTIMASLDLFMCSHRALDHISGRVTEAGLNGVCAAKDVPRNHSLVFQNNVVWNLGIPVN
jgi:heterodisulfide reductase subunit A-like polyferredoxin